MALKLTELSERCGRVRSHVPASVAELAADGDALDLVAFNLMLGLRNIVAHGYAGLDVASCHSAATRGLVDLEAFAQQVSSWVNRSS